MNLYLQYHNVQNEGLILDNPPFSPARLAIHTRRPNVQKAEGWVFLIAGIGRPRRFFLWETFQIEEVTPNDDGEFEASGSGWQLAPPVELTGKPFEEFKAACANFVGFRCINDRRIFDRTVRQFEMGIHGPLSLRITFKSRPLRRPCPLLPFWGRTFRHISPTSNQNC